ncbi:hypothetical protein L6R52_44050, partial [Myxococcota bacterium]|nr:hypothetical protein [Myxococcota bacterium]
MTSVRALGLVSPLLVVALLASGACSSDSGGGDRTPSDASTPIDSGTTTGTVADAGELDAGDDAGAVTPDGGNTTADASTRDASSVDASGGPDGGGSTSQACMDLLDCCATAP